MKSFRCVRHRIALSMSGSILPMEASTIASAHGRGQVWRQVDVEPPAGFGQGASSSPTWKNDSPSGFMASVIIC